MSATYRFDKFALRNLTPRDCRHWLREPYEDEGDAIGASQRSIDCRVAPVPKPLSTCCTHSCTGTSPRLLLPARTNRFTWHVYGLKGQALSAARRQSGTAARLHDSGAATFEIKTHASDGSVCRIPIQSRLTRAFQPAI